MADKNFCRFTMFVKLWPGIISHWPDRQRVWCMRGDKFTDVHSKQIRNLLNHAKKSMHLYCIIELYDNSYSHDNEKRMILEYKQGVFVKNNLAQYQQSLKGFPLPEQFKS